MAVVHRKSAPGVCNGRVQKKNNHLAHPSDFYRVAQNEIRIVRERPGEGYRHILTVGDVIRFLELLPSRMGDYLKGIDGIVLATGQPGYYGLYDNRGVIELCAWPRGLHEDMDQRTYDNNRVILDRLGVVLEPDGENWYIAQWTEEQARAFLLLDVFPHELGHHADRMTSKRRRECGRGEPFAETFVREMLPELWDRYWRAIRR